MANFLKIGHVFLNLDLVQTIEDQFPTTREDRFVVRFGDAETQARTFTGRDADDLRTWLNSRAINLQDPTDLATEGRAL